MFLELCREYCGQFRSHLVDDLLDMTLGLGGTPECLRAPTPSLVFSSLRWPSGSKEEPRPKSFDDLLDLTTKVLFLRLQFLLRCRSKSSPSFAAQSAQASKSHGKQLYLFLPLLTISPPPPLHTRTSRWSHVKSGPRPEGHKSNRPPHLGHFKQG